MNDEQINRLINALEEIGYGGRDSTPGGALEGISLALGGMGTGGKGFEHPIGEELGTGLHEIAGAIESISHGSDTGPTGLEMLSMSVAGDGLGSPIGPAIESGLTEIAEAISGGLSEIAQAIAGLNNTNSA